MELAVKCIIYFRVDEDVDDPIRTAAGYLDELAERWDDFDYQVIAAEQRN